MRKVRNNPDPKKSKTGRIQNILFGSSMIIPFHNDRLFSKPPPSTESSKKTTGIPRKPKTYKPISTIQDRETAVFNKLKNHIAV